jgi:transglutaminase superfamily protein
MSMPVALEPSVRLPWPRRAAAWSTVAIARMLIRLSPRRLRQVLQMAQCGARPATQAQALVARQAVVSVSLQCAGQGCLQRSVATALLCRLGGTWPDWCTGIRAEPFRAHAWVEVDGEPVGEREEIRLYHKVMTIRRHREDEHDGELPLD